MSSKEGTSSSSNTDSGSYSGGSGSGGSNESEHDKRQKKLQANINKLKAKGATKEAIAGLTAKKTKEAKKFELKTTGIEEGRRYVQEKLGLVETKAGPMDYLQKGKTTGMYASKLTGTKGGTGFYGQEASAATDEYLEKSGVAKGSALWNELKYGISNSAMGSGDPTGIMTSTAISQPMHKRQQKIKAMALAALSFAAPMPASSLMRLGAMESYGKMGQAGYSQYLDKFYSNVAGTTSSYGVKSKGTGNGKEQEVSSVNINETRTDTKKSVSDETRFTSLKAVTKGGGTVTDADRTLLKRSGKTIKAGIVST
tara:strand:+ start:35 stop:970 length:936 start_codon:yes stop_codon:yes gene_type:complete